jgi:hypothetical protein
MKVYRAKMQNMGLTNKDIITIQKKAHDFKTVIIKDIMIIDNRGYKCAAPSFDLNDLIVAQAEFTENTRSQVKKRNVEILAILRKLRDDLIEKDLEFKKGEKDENDKYY